MTVPQSGRPRPTFVDFLPRRASCFGLLRLQMYDINIFRALGDMSHLAAFVLLLVKLHASRSATGEDLKPGHKRQGSHNGPCREKSGKILHVVRTPFGVSSVELGGVRLQVD